jgi:hypothetical protein
MGDWKHESDGLGKEEEAMASTYKEKLIKEIEETPQEIIPKLYEMMHHLRNELMQKAKMSRKRGSLKGIWKGSHVDEKLFSESKSSLFPYEGK